MGMPDGAVPPSPSTATTAAKRSRSTSDITNDGEKGAEEGRGRRRAEDVRMVVVCGGGYRVTGCRREELGKRRPIAKADDVARLGERETDAGWWRRGAERVGGLEVGAG